MRIGFIGLGNMGGPMALNVLKAGHTLVVSDVRQESAKPHLDQGAAWAETPEEVARGSEVIFTSLPSPREVEAVALGPDGILHGAARGAVYVDLSTSSATLIRHIHRVFAEVREVHVLDAPVSGGVPGARSGKLAVLVGGDDEVYRRVKPVLDAIGDKVMRVGEIGSGTIAKLVHNMVSACTRMAIAEGLTLGVKAGVAPEALLDALQKGSFGQGRLLKEMIPDIVFPGAFEPANFALRLLRKDVG
ncbi:MAG: 3-hydroxyisobutyrate dehydrogenase, partial [Candidatus Rokuibacteriota bacterium]